MPNAHDLQRLLRPAFLKLRLLSLTTAAAIAASTLATMPVTANAEIIDRVVARVNEAIITQSDLVRLMPIYVQVLGIDPARFDSETGRNDVANELLEFLVTNRLLMDASRERDLVVSDSEVDAYVDSQRESMGLTTQQFRQELSSQGIDVDDFRDFVRGNVTRQRMVQVDLGSSLQVTDEEIDAAMAAQYPEGLTEQVISTSHILVSLPLTAGAEEEEAARVRIEEISAALGAGGTFETLASETNPDGSRARGGRLGSFSVDELDQEFVRAALALEVGDVSAPVRTQFGYHIIRLDGLERRAIADEGQLRDRVAFELYNERAEREQRLYLQRIRSEGFVEVRVTEFNF
ncbi:MAG: peptidyl-prolyl cis-trans isomerase SurA [Bradymonadia bacterium]|jgi:peptidyl-prolyl cis-trans isomerase SurA